MAILWASHRLRSTATALKIVARMWKVIHALDSHRHAQMIVSDIANVNAVVMRDRRVTIPKIAAVVGISICAARVVVGHEKNGCKIRAEAAGGAKGRLF